MTPATLSPDPTACEAATAMRTAVETFVASEVLPQVTDWDAADILPESALARLGEIGVPGALVPADYGGLGLSVSDLVPIWRTLAHGWISLTGAVNTTHLGTALLLRYGTQAQREEWLPRIASGEVWSSFSITEPGAGSDLKRLSTRVEAVDGGLLVNGEKRWIAGGLSFPLAFMLATGAGAARPSCVLLPAVGRPSPSWSVELLDKLGYRGVESAAWRFQDHYAPGAEILGGITHAGSGVRQMIDVLGIGRVNVACRALGIIDRALAAAVAESTGRTIGQGVLGDHTHAQMRLGELRARQLTVEALVCSAASAVDARAENAGDLATAAKVFASDSAVWAVDVASRLAASRSYTAEAELARLRRDAPQTQIGEGANDALLLAVGRGVLRTQRGARGR
ncbi:acyl-CoA dehydrogenase family protein [Conexibacter sp. DBS9H8]|uniref:acyl-CoA dehydrogenase family protein n=1 Tax=Conexibacter sp. DBS9H8 TaxID=2937801 RepID=UPI00200F1437|nr:acyl-CoA dehydrogenase family protein [Conexibacter sp. DBS9H8]